VTSNWVPVQLPGGVYCSPSCGFGCTRADYDRAIKESAELADRMGSGWMPRVWENGAWHYEVTKGVASISPMTNRNVSGPYRIDGYLVMFNSVHQVVARAKTPEDALGFAVQDARTIERRIADDLMALLK
jgi:hypothetical protein